MFPAKSKHLRNSGKPPPKTQNKRTLGTTLLWVCSPKRFEAVFRFSELETCLFWELCLDIPE